MKNGNEANFGLRLRDAFKGVSQTEIARQLGLSNSAVSNYVEGRIPPAETLTKIAGLTGYSIHWLITGEGPRRVYEQETQCQTIMLVNEKGGSTKSVSAVMLAFEFAKRGYRTLLVDARHGDCAFMLYGPVMPEFEELEASLSINNSQRFRKVRKFFRTEVPGLHLCVSRERSLLSLARGGVKSFSVGADVIKRDYDFVVMDTDSADNPFEPHDLFTYTLMESAQMLIPVRAHPATLGSVEATLTDLHEAIQYPIDIRLLGAFLTLFDSGSKTSRMVVEELNRLMPGKVLKTIIHEDKRIGELGIHSQAELLSTKSPGFAEYSHLADEVLHLLGKPQKAKSVHKHQAGRR